MSKSTVFSCNLLLLFTLFSLTSAGDNITQAQPLKDGQTIVSAGGSFELGFFRPGNSKNRYLGIWFAVSKETVVWVANRGKPLNDSSGVLMIEAGGGLLLTDKANGTIWSSGVSTAGSTVARLQDSGNLVLADSSSANTDAAFLWQSFDYPTDTLLAGMKLGRNFRRGLNWSLTSWRSPDDPSPGPFSFELDTVSEPPQPFLCDNKRLTFRGGPWMGPRFSGTPEMKSYDMFNFSVVVAADEIFYRWGITKPHTYARLYIDPTGILRRLVWDESTHAWSLFFYGPKDRCDDYAFCAANGICDINRSPMCSCLRGFQPKSQDQWYIRNWNGGCVRRTKLNCSDADGFVVVPQLKLPDTATSISNTRMSLGECRALCLKNCSCSAYATANISDGSGCIIWFGDLVDSRSYTENGQEIYLRLAASELDSTSKSGGKTKVAVVVTVVVLSVLLLLVVCGCWMRRKRKKRFTSNESATVSVTRRNYFNKSHREDDPELPLFDLDTMASATNEFSEANRLGKGGFGVVYKGTMEDGREVAVKRLTLHSGQGVDAFMNEAVLIAKLQHRNLVQLLGCCIEGEERMLIYEYMPNRSLDDFIFADSRKRALLDWRKRLDIIMGVARGLLYLHQDSRLRIIHRDLKAGNVLLDAAMNPKISDFGTARILVRDQTQDNTLRIVGTIGYMSPEYALDGNFSEKSDVFSFGVLVLEIISGRKNRWVSSNDFHLNLLAHTWRLWVEEQCVELLDDTVPNPCPVEEVLRCIQVGLLCVQESPEDRPTMQQVVLMMVNEHSALPQPKRPGYVNPSKANTGDCSSSGQVSNSLNKITVTNMEGR